MELSWQTFSCPSNEIVDKGIRYRNLYYHRRNRTIDFHSNLASLDSTAGHVDESKGITPDKEIIAYCRIGERSSHTWFVFKYLLGYPNVKNYDGSWTEWGNMIANPIEKD